MNKKTIITSIIIFLVLSTPLASATTIYIEHKNVLNNTNYPNTIDYNGIKINYSLGWSKISSSGIGFHVIYALKVLKFNAPIPTPQYHNFFPFKIDLFITWCKYMDENATTIITPVRGEPIPPVTGNHSFIIAFLKIPAMNLLKQLLNDGIIDGIQGMQQLWHNYFNISPPLAARLREIIKTIHHDEPFIDICNETEDFLRALSGVTPRYDNWSTPIFNFPLIKDFRDNHSLINLLLFKQLRYLFFILIPGMIWNHLPIRMSFLHLIIPQKLIGYTPFVIWWENSQNFKPGIEDINDLLSEILFQKNHLDVI